MDFDQSETPRPRPLRQLPSFYYHAHFVELLDFVSECYAHALREGDERFLDSFRGLDRNAQCLYVRLVNRKGRIFAASRLRYPELGRIEPLLGKLRQAGLVGSPGSEHFDEILGHLTRDELHSILSANTAGISRSLRKAELLKLAQASVAPESLSGQLRSKRLVVQRQADAVRYLLFLFFGRVHESLSQFTMRDLGLVRVNESRDTFEPRFGEREEALENYYFALRKKRAEDPQGLAFEALVAEAEEWPEPEYAGTARIRDALAVRLGRMLEKMERADDAARMYARGESATCVERRFRILFGRGDRDDARALLDACLARPRSDEEWLVARDLYEQKFEKKRTSAQTDLLRAGEIIEIDESQSGAPERAAAAWFEERGVRAFRAENAIWRTLFGLLFWRELFESDGVHSPFEFRPSCLDNGTFYELHAGAVKERLKLLDDRKAATRQLLKVGTAQYGTPNGVFRWNRAQLDAVFALVDAAQPESLRSILGEFVANYADARHGYPDLLLLDAEGPRFVEIKTRGDRLRRNQMLRLEQLRAAGFRADVVRIDWVLDPEQVYVVVDVETTGGRGEQHRVTEIGAVRVRDGRIIDRFETLLNPQRTIPPGITKLTGISGDMVASAPYFADVADEFAEFLADAIFVAHNVDFDYGFIAREYRRLGRGLRLPKLCTCASMRRLYPGHRSYSLGSLCRAYDIPLKNHHRALCDAEAAAELLLLINEKRLQQQGADSRPY